jgi:hypothetical protein
VGTSCHTAHVNPIVHFCPDSLQHDSVYGCHRGDDALSQFLKIIWQGWYVAGGSIPKCVRNSRCTVVTELVFAKYRIQNAFCCEIAILQHGLPWWRRPETLSRFKQTNFESFPNNRCISRDCRLTGYFIINMWKCYLLFELLCFPSHNLQSHSLRTCLNATCTTDVASLKELIVSQS